MREIVHDHMQESKQYYDDMSIRFTDKYTNSHKGSTRAKN
jgi:hypothetical protein